MTQQNKKTGSSSGRKARRRTNVVGAIIVGVGIALAACTHVDEMTPEDIVRGYVAAHNSHDVAGAMAFFADDAEFLIPSQKPVIGRDAIRDLERWDAAIDSALEFGGITARALGNGQTAIDVERIVESNDWFRAIGLEHVVYLPGDAVFVLNEAGKIIRIKPARLRSSCEEVISGAINGVMAWLSETDPRRRDVLMPDGVFSYTGESAEQWLRTIADWLTERERTQSEAAAESCSAP